jgi:hypothetical protein
LGGVFHIQPAAHVPAHCNTGKPNTLPVVFAHANSFPIGTYRLLFSCCASAASKPAACSARP